ncbi:HisA/HisF-related TIM barrel protein [Methyloradius palustris]|uniref:Nickel transporter n=1 Tax=Methyloradius palustris TaxID=2778876 RepID=A0A8D5FZD7_9PROT|nr:HisA/HisF-related TIM barrel protein [Methyloradius palustris]BCM24932.1 nickel transporter [Methyloradius palustris]
MKIIPVIDLLDGQVVHAKLGDRQNYQAIISTLCDSSEPLDIVHALMRLYRFDRLYIADLNAIQKHGNHLQIITEIQHHYPKLEIWLDAGFSVLEATFVWADLDIRLVVGTESLIDIADYHAIMKDDAAKEIVLSLDFKQDGYHGPLALLHEPSLWPKNVIIMSLPKVGSGLGPDIKKLSEFVIKNPQHHFYAAGGVRHAKDLLELHKLGIQGALVASAIHSGLLNQKSINETSLLR